MAVPAVTAVRAWLNSRPGLTGRGNPLAQGAYLEGGAVRSPAHGAYARLILEPGTSADLVAEPGGPSVARITAHIFSGSIESGQAAAVAVNNAFQSLAGNPERCGSTGVVILAAANFAEPGYVPAPGEGGEQHEFTCGADLVLYQP